MGVTQQTIDGLKFNKTDESNSWRLIYKKNEDWARLFETDGFTQSICTIEIVEDEQAGIDRINELGLNRIDQEIN